MNEPKLYVHHCQACLIGFNEMTCPMCRLIAQQAGYERLEARQKRHELARLAATLLAGDEPTWRTNVPTKEQFAKFAVDAAQAILDEVKARVP